jgi:hypothetical protein
VPDSFSVIREALVVCIEDRVGLEPAELLRLARVLCGYFAQRSADVALAADALHGLVRRMPSGLRSEPQPADRTRLQTAVCGDHRMCITGAYVSGSPRAAV